MAGKTTANNNHQSMYVAAAVQFWARSVIQHSWGLCTMFKSLLGFAYKKILKTYNIQLM